MKGVRLTEDQMRTALQMYGTGADYRVIDTATGVSEASMTGLVAKEAERDPDFRGCHEVAVLCRKKHAAAETFLRGSAVADRISGNGSSLDEVEEKVLPFIQKHGSDSGRLAEQAERVNAAEAATGLKIEEMPSALLKASDKVRKSEETYARVEAETGKLRKETRELSDRLEHLADLERIKISLEKANRSPEDAAEALERSEKVLGQGLTNEAMEALGTEFEKRRMDPEGAASAVAELVLKHGGLSEAVKVEEDKLAGLTGKVGRATRTLAGKGKVRDSMVREIESLTPAVDDLRKQYTRQAKVNEKAEKTHRRGMTELEQATRDRCDAMLAEAKTDHDRLVGEGVGAKNSLIAEGQRQQANLVAAGKKEKNEIIEKAVRTANYYDNQASESKMVVENLQRTAGAMKTQISASGTLWGFISEDRPATFSELQELQKLGPLRARMPLPESIRLLLIHSVADLLTEDDKQRLHELARKLEQTKKQTSETLAESSRTVKAAEGYTTILLEAQRLCGRGGVAVEVIARALIDKPSFMAKVIFDSPDERVIEILRAMGGQQRDRLRSCMVSAEKQEDAELERLPTAAYYVMQRRMCSQMLRDYGVYVAPDPIPTEYVRQVLPFIAAPSGELDGLPELPEDTSEKRRKALLPKTLIE